MGTETEMTPKQIHVLEDICRRVRERYPESLTGYRSFISSALQPENDEPVTLHVFLMSHFDYNEVYDYVQALVVDAAHKQGVHFAFAIWNSEQSRQHFAADIERLSSQAPFEPTSCSVAVEVSDAWLPLGQVQFNCRLLAEWPPTLDQTAPLAYGRWLLTDVPQQVTQESTISYGKAA